MNAKLVALFCPSRRLIASWRRRGHALLERLAPGPWRLEATVPDMDGVPPRIPPRRAYLVANATYRKWLVFDCPCGNGHRIVLNLDSARRPAWSVRLSKAKALTLSPSVDYRDDRRACHYVLSNGRVAWVDNVAHPHQTRLRQTMSDTSATPAIEPPVMPRTPRHAAAQSARPRSRLIDIVSLSRYRRSTLMRAIEAKTKRKLLCYVSGGTINALDTFHLARLIETVTPCARITLLLDSPGGDVDAAEKMVHLLQEASAPLTGNAGDLEVVVPNAAKSAATLIALGADRIVMSDSSELGPIDPQLQIAGGGSVPVFAVIRAYEEAEQRCVQHPGNSAFAAELGKFDAILIAEMRQVVDRARACAENLLKRKGANYTAVAADLMDIDRFPSHGQMIDWRTAKDIGIPHVHHLPRNDPLWQLYWRLYRYLLPVSGSDGRVLESLDRTITVSGPAGG